MEVNTKHIHEGNTLMSDSGKLALRRIPPQDLLHRSSLFFFMLDASKTKMNKDETQFSVGAAAGLGNQNTE